MNKRNKMVGVPVSKEEVIKELGTPSAEWERSSRALEFRNHLIHGQTELDIAGIRGYASIRGYLKYLEQSLEKPLGVGTNLVSKTVNEAIWAELEPEILSEIERYRIRLVELEKSPEAVAVFIGRMKWWLEHLTHTGPGDPSKETDDIAHAIAVDGKNAHEQEVATLNEEIQTYTELLANLRASSPTA